MCQYIQKRVLLIAVLHGSDFMKTQIDCFLNEYMNEILEVDIEAANVRKLLERVRQEYALSGVCIYESRADKYCYVNTYYSLTEDMEYIAGLKVYVEPEDYDGFVADYDEDNICCKVEKNGCSMSYGYIENSENKGMIVFVDKNDRVWSEEEREALKKLARAVHSFVILSEAKQFLVEHMEDGTEKERLYRLELENSNKNLKRVLNSNDGLFRQMLKMQSCGMIAYRLPGWELFMMNDLAKDIFDCDNEYEFEQFDAPNITYKNQEETLNRIMMLTETGEMISYEFEVLHGDGEKREVEAVSKIIETEAGDRFFISSFRDITIQRRLEDDIKREKMQYREAILSDAIVAYTFDVTEGIIESQFEIKSTARGKKKIVLEPPFEYDEFIRRWDEEKKPQFLNGGTSKQVMRQALLNAYEKGKNNLVFDYEVPSEDYCLRNTILLSTNPSNGHVIACVTLKDVTELLWMEERRQNELRTTNEYLKRQMFIINSLGDIYFAVIYCDIHSKHYSRVSARGRISDLLDHAGIFSDQINVLVEKWVDEAYKQKVAEFSDLSTLAQRMEDTNVIYCEFVTKEYGWVRANFIRARMDDEGKLKQVLFTIQVIDEEKKKELEQQEALAAAFREADKANHAKSDFLSKISHDIRTPLNAIIGMTAIASSRIDDKDKVSNCLREITNSGHYLLDLINEVLDMSKIEAGKIKLSEGKFNILGLVDNIISMTKPLLKDKNQEIILDLDDIEHRNVIGDSLRVQQIFTNLLSNFIKYTSDFGKLHLSIHEKKSEKPMYGCYEITFEDNGIGMSEEFLEKIFTPFERAQDSRTDTIQGTGLGMAIVVNLAKLMGGDVKVSSKLNVGSKFVVTIYLKLQKENEFVEEDYTKISDFERPLDALSEIDLTDKRILLVEDNEINREIAIEIISETGVAIETAADGQEAIDMVLMKPAGYYDLIFMDIQMPVKNGYEATMELRAMDRDDLKEIPIVAMTANAFAEDVQEAKAAGMNEHVSKPIDLIRLREVLKRWI